MTIETYRRAFVFGAQRHTGMIGKKDTGELAVLAVGGASSLILGWVLPGLALKLLGLLVPASLAAAAVFAPYRPRGSRIARRTWYRWYEPTRAYRRMLRGGAAWRSSVREAGIHLDGSEPVIALPPGLGRQTWLTTEIAVNGQQYVLAVVLHPDRRCWTAVLEIEPSGLGRLDYADQSTLLDLFGGHVLNGLGNGASHGSRLQILARQLKSDPQAHDRDVVERGDPSSAPWLRESYATLQAQLSTSAEDHRFYAVLSVDHTVDLVVAAEVFGGGDRGVARIVGREVETLARRFTEARLPVAGALGVVELASLIRNSYSPDHPVDDLAGMRRNRAWPQEVDARPESEVVARLSTGQAWHHTTAAITAWPQSPVGVDFLAPLLVQMPDTIRTVSVVFTLERNHLALRRLRAESTDDQAERDRAAKLGCVADPLDSRTLRQISNRGEELAGGAAGAGLVGYVTVSARSSDELWQLRRDVEATAESARLSLEWADREQARAFTNTLPFASGSA